MERQMDQSKTVYVVYRIKIGDPSREKDIIGVYNKEWVAVEIADMLQESQEIWGPIEWVYSLHAEQG
jgi:hypothetical protein